MNLSIMSLPQPPHTARRRKLILPRIQLRFVAVFAFIGTLALLVQALLLTTILPRLARSLPNDGIIVLNELPGIVTTCLGVSIGLMLPLMLAVGVLITFRIAGPIYRFQMFLKGVLDGTETRDCRLRKGDELTELCELINRATREQRLQNASALNEPEGEATNSLDAA